MTFFEAAGWKWWLHSEENLMPTPEDDPGHYLPDAAWAAVQADAAAQAAGEPPSDPDPLDQP